MVITVDKSTVLVSSPVHVMVSGLDPGEAATLAITTTDAGAHVWSSSASFKADGNGQIDLSRVTPSGGSYTEEDGMCLFRSMKPAGPSQGRIPASNQLARESAWPQLLTFLAGVARS